MALAFSPDGKRLAIGGGSPAQPGLGAISVLSVDDDAPAIELPGHEPITRTLAFSPDGARLLSGGRDRRVRMFAMPSGELVATLDHAQPVLGVAWSSDGTLIATCGGAPVEGERELIVWNVGDSGAPTRIATLETHAAGVYSVDFSPDGTRLASSGIDGTIRVYDLAGEELLCMRHDAAVWSVAYSPDGTQLASGSHDHTARIWDATTGAELHRLERHQDFVACVRWSTDGDQVLTAGNDGVVHTWRDGSYRSPVMRFDVGAWALALDRAGNVAMAAIDGTVSALPESYVF